MLVAVEQSNDVVRAGDLVAELHAGRGEQPLLERILALEIGMLA